MNRLYTALLGAALAFAALGCTSVHTELVIPAEPAEIWAVITDSTSYPDWNPVIYRVDGSYAVGAELTNHLREPSGREYTLESTVQNMVPERELHQAGGTPGLLRFNHRYLLEPVEGGTRVTQHEDYTGIGVLFWDNDWVEPAYASVNRALSDHLSSSAADAAN